MQTKHPVFQLNDVSIGYKESSSRHKVVYQSLNFSLHLGELTCLLGANGIGKSTLLKTITQGISPLSGDIALNNIDLASHSSKDLSKLISVVLTDKIFAGGLRVSELVAMGRYPYTKFWGRLSGEDKSIIEWAMQATGIAVKKDCFFAELSDGEKQKVMISKALAQQTPIILLDEPTSFLDIISRLEIMSLLQHLAHKENKAILLSTHDIEQAIAYSDRLWLLQKNGKHQSGSPEDLLLKNAFEHLFDHEHILFDHTNAKYHHHLSDSHIPIKVWNESTLSPFWVKNYLTRYGYKKSVQDACTLSIVIHKDYSISVIESNRKLHFTSFESLSKWLKAFRYSKKDSTNCATPSSSFEPVI